MSELGEAAGIDDLGARVSANPDDPVVFAEAIAEIRKSPALASIADALLQLRMLVVLRSRYLAEGDLEGAAEIEAEIDEARRGLVPGPPGA
jgi:hypothetical protein